MKEQLREIIQNMDITKETKAKLDKALYRTPGIKTFLVTKIREKLLEGDIDITEEQAENLVNTLGGSNKINKSTPKTIEIPERKTNEEVESLKNMYNTTLVEVEQLRKELKKKEDEQKAKDELLKQMQQQMELNTQALQEVNKLKKLQNILKKLDVTKLNKLFEVPDDSINELYLEYLTDRVKKSGLAYIFEQDNKLIIPKAYYVVENEGGCK